MDTSETIWFLIGCALVVGYLALVVYVAWDLFRRDLALWAKLAWLLSFLLFPLLSVIFYVVVGGYEPREHPSLSKGRPPS